MSRRLNGEEFSLYVSQTEPATGYDDAPGDYTPDIADYEAVALLRTFSIEGSRNLADLTTWDDDDDGVFRAGRRERNANVAGLLDAEEDNGQKAFADAFDSEGGELYFLLMPPGDSQVVRHGKAITTGYSEGYEQDNGVTFSGTLRVTGPLVRTKTPAA